jgi:protein tyrosine/serine phosphatase
VKERKKGPVARALALSCLVLALAVGAYAAVLFYTDNFHTIVPGQAFRSGQMTSNELTSCIRKHSIRSIVNLRGDHPEMRWFSDEVVVAKHYGVMHRSVAISSGKPASEAKILELSSILQRCPKPVLIHCDGGADRAAFAAALYRYAVAREPVAMAEQEFSIWYGHLPIVWPRKRALRDSLRRHIAMQQRSGAADLLTRAPVEPQPIVVEDCRRGGR